MPAFAIESLERRTLFAGTISGIVFDDLNGNGVREPGDPGLANQRVFIDLNFNGTLQNNEPSVLTNASGAYSFTNRPNGIQRVRYQLPTGRRFTAPASVFFDVPVANNVTSNRNFGSTTASVVTGFVFNDLNNNGVRDLGEPGLAGWTLFIDKNNNGKFDAGERSRVTNSTGAYRVTPLAPGTYRLRLVLKPGFALTTPLSGVITQTVGTAQTFSNRNFGVRII